MIVDQVETKVSFGYAHLNLKTFQQAKGFFETMLSIENSVILKEDQKIEILRELKVIRDKTVDLLLKG